MKPPLRVSDGFSVVPGRPAVGPRDRARHLEPAGDLPLLALRRWER